MTEPIFQGEWRASVPNLSAIEFKKRLEEIDGEIGRLSADIHQLENELDFFLLAPSDIPLLTAVDPSVVAKRETLRQQYQDLQTLQAQKQEWRQQLSKSSDEIGLEIIKNSREEPPLIVEGRLGSAMAALGEWDEAVQHFDRAAKEAQGGELDLEAADFRWQSLLADLHKNPDWKSNAKQIEKFLQDVNREVGLRNNPPEEFGLWLADRGDTESWRILRLEALGALAELFLSNNQLENQTLEQIEEHLSQYLQEIEQNGASSQEIVTLFEALEQLQRCQMARGYQLGADAKLEPLEELNQKMSATLLQANQVAQWHPDDHEIAEALGVLRGLTHFHFWKEAGLPTKAVANYWRETANTPSTEADVKLKQLILEKAPHFFDGQGNLLPPDQITPPQDSEQAAYAENSLHHDDPSLAESLLIGGGVSIGGSAGGAKLAGAAGFLCGPWAEICVPLGATGGGIAGYLGGDKILEMIHASDRKVFVDDVKMAGLGLSRLSLKDADHNEMWRTLLTTAGLGMMGVAAGPASRSGGKLFAGLGWTLRPVTWRFVGKQIVSEGSYSLRWLQALKNGAAGAFRKTATATAEEIAKGVEATPKILEVAPSFDDVWFRLPPWQQAKGRSYWEGIWKQMPTTVVPPAEKGAPPLIDKILAPVNWVWDKSIGQATRFGANRLQAIRQAVLAQDPALSYRANPLIALKELRRAETLASQGISLSANGNGHAKFPAFERMAKWMQVNIGTEEFVRVHRWGFPFAAAGLFYDSDGQEGGGIRWDGEIDGPWEFIPFFLWTNSISKPLLDNNVVAADIAGAINLFTIDRMLDNDDYEGGTDYDRYRGAHFHYFVSTAANSVFISGHHYARKFALGQLAGSIPGIRLLPSMTSFAGAFRNGSSLDKPNFFTLNGLALTLFYQSYLTGNRVSAVFSHKNLVNTDSYYSWQRGTKYAVPVPIINAVQTALGYRTALGQTTGRILGVPPDLGLAIIFDPFLNKGRYENKERRLLEDGSEEALVDAWKVFTRSNTTLDVGGIVGRMISETGTEFLGWKPLRAGHWRWERRGVETWTSPDPLPSLDGRKGLIEEMAETGDTKKIRSLTEMYRHQFLDPKAPWHTDLKDQHGMMIFAFATQYFAQKALDGNSAFDPFLELTQTQELRPFFHSIPVPKDHDQLLDYVQQVDEGQFVWVLQKAPEAPKIPDTEEHFPSVTISERAI